MSPPQAPSSSTKPSVSAALPHPVLPLRLSERPNLRNRKVSVREVAFGAKGAVGRTAGARKVLVREVVVGAPCAIGLSPGDRRGQLAPPQVVREVCCPAPRLYGAPCSLDGERVRGGSDHHSPCSASQPEPSPPEGQGCLLPFHG